MAAASNRELSERLQEIVAQRLPQRSHLLDTPLLQCLMLDFSRGPEEVRQHIYHSWTKFEEKEGRLI